MEDQELVRLAFSMHQYSYVPYSRFPVGAALLCEDGRVFTGCNVENAAYGSTICAERTALLKAVSEGCRTGWTTCGPCRQMLYEFAPDLRVLAARGDGEFQEAGLSQLLPHGFGPESLK